MSVSQNFPDEGPSLSLNFAGAEKLDSRITFTRSSTGTYLDRSGLVVTASANSPRFDHSYNGSNVESLGLLIEESRTNLRTYSGIPSANWSANNSAVVTNNSAVSPDGTTNATQIAGAATIGSGVFQTNALTSGTAYTYSLFVKAVSGSNTIYFGTDTGTNATVQVNTSTGVAVTNSGGTVTNITSTSYPSGWYRISFTFTAATTGTHSFVIYNLTANVNTWLAYGAQVEAGAFPTSYIPTVASTVTRSADNASMTGTNFSSWYNSTAATGGTILVQARRGYSGNFSGYPNLYEIGDGTNNNRIIVYGIVSSTEYTLNIQTSGVQQLDYVFDTISTTNLFKTINSFATNSSTLCFNGSLKTTDTSVTLPAANRLFIGCVNGFGNLWNGTISSLSYYPTRLTNSQLQNLTK